MLWAILTRAFHLDGLADCADGLGGGYTRERRLEIVKDPHTGAFGVVAIVCVLLLKYAALSGGTFFVSAWLYGQGVWLRQVLLLALVCSLGRLSVLLVAAGSNYARAEGGLGRDFIAGAGWGVLMFGCIVPAGLAYLVLEGRALWPVAAVIGAALLLRLIFSRALGGQTGDTLGATVEICEVVALVTISGG